MSNHTLKIRESIRRMMGLITLMQFAHNQRFSESHGFPPGTPISSHARKKLTKQDRETIIFTCGEICLCGK